ncbi:MAG: Peptidase [Hyphomicrobiales bacterium]|nr:Peptidase [Hyphomicrobiales bacterium]
MVRFALAGAAAAVLAGCSSDSSRLAEGPFGAADHTPTASIGSRNPLNPPETVGYGAPQTASAAPVSPVRSTSLAPVSAVQSAPLAAPSMPTRPNYSAAPVSTPVAQAAAKAATKTAASARGAVGGAGPWTANGGTPVTLGQGETVATLANRYGVPQDALLKVNGFSSASQVTTGTRLTIPVYNSGSTGAAANAAVAAAPAAAATPVAAAVGTRALASKPAALGSQPLKAAQSEAAQAGADAKSKVDAARKEAARAQFAKTEAAKAEAAAKVASADPLKVEAARKLADQKKLAAAEQAKLAKAKADEAKAAQAKVAQAKSDKTQAAADKAVSDKPKAVAALAPAPAAEPETTASVPAGEAKPEFRWPARGRIIQGFRNGANEGINIAVPEGTSVKAAESGVVAYAGSELKGYGNLVLIKHPNGYVSAYAHNGDVSVKRGETVKRGQTIARSGQSGNVSSPQLHFELRKGSTPVDPTGYLAGL